ncbi:hypothetical protein OTU49_017504 [Cherax quadricarinatus]|uniref:Chloride channel CLIC-like protein 1 n=1 Tax=Cherax quadricarinatus TaxID=27406 RepID=A0AAW0VTH9_CHEQU
MSCKMALKTCCLWMLAVGIILEILGCYYQLFDPWVRDLEKERDDLRREVDQATDACQPVFYWFSLSTVLDVWQYVSDTPVQETSTDSDLQFDPRWLPVIGRVITAYECYTEIQNLKTLLLEVTSHCHECSSTPFTMTVLCVLMSITMCAMGLIAPVKLWRRPTGDTLKMAMVRKPKTNKHNRRRRQNASKKTDQDQTQLNGKQMKSKKKKINEVETINDVELAYRLTALRGARNQTGIYKITDPKKAEMNKMTANKAKVKSLTNGKNKRHKSVGV